MKYGTGFQVTVERLLAIVFAKSNYLMLLPVGLRSVQAKADRKNIQVCAQMTSQIALLKMFFLFALRRFVHIHKILSC